MAIWGWVTDVPVPASPPCICGPAAAHAGVKRRDLGLGQNPKLKWPELCIVQRDRLVSPGRSHVTPE